MKHLKAGILTALLVLLLATNGFGQSLPAGKTKLGIEIDPITFAFGGFGLHLRIQPKTASHLLVGVGAYPMNLPQALVDVNPNNQGQGWSVRIRQGYGLFAEHHFTEVNRKWFVGAQLGLQQFKIGRAEYEGRERFSNGLAMAYFGYAVKPFGDRFYFKPWAGVGYTSQVSGTATLGTAAYDIAPVTFFATLHIGYAF